MKKYSLVFLFMLVTAFGAQAQVFTFGLKAGVSSSSVDVDNPKGSFMQFKQGDNITGFHAGAFTRLKVMGFLLQPEAVFSKSGGKLEYNDGQGGTVVEKVGFTNLDVPIMVGYSFLFARAYAGPVASVLIKSDIGKDDMKEYLNSADWGIQVGAGVDISRLTADVRYERLKRTYTDPTTGNIDFRNQQIILSLGYKLIGK